ncbi:hypothetical protein PFICI_14770 [Pestalotiopsis fici W106-1]|uniref:Transcription factor domain-containing protein n=1 Tax=Pestalotiopsis fici (strain W106-1 / CGMCC3.15140) TaxID=1229662 RepID=W3WJ84_PESFW|nr:uncharacterized protein PFICI_14770 [Pestalotiopsis fici W106-1]ETS73824.1 hypothetical protein PFICI_14770 [Pestalotiopsis fici W106-1]
MQKNNFNPSDPLYDADIKTILGYQSSGFLLRAMLAVGALEASKWDNRSSALEKHYLQDSQSGIQSYSAAIVELRNHMEFHESPSQIQVLWTTLFVGLFELMHDSTGAGWIKHMVHGTSKAVAATGPEFFQSKPGRSFFAQARVFEACRAIIFNDATFLTGPQWLDFSTQTRDESVPASVSPPDSLNDLLIIVVLCSKLSVRVGHFVREYNQLNPVDATSIAADFAIEGGRLRERLRSWREANSIVSSISLPLDTHGFHNEQISVPSGEALLANAFFSATAIYLSGIFDYNVTLWKGSMVSPPTLNEQDIQAHSCRGKIY